MCVFCALPAWAKLPVLSPLPLPEATVEVGGTARKGWVLYTVRPGDTLASLSQRFGRSP